MSDKEVGQGGEESVVRLDRTAAVDTKKVVEEKVERIEKPTIVRETIIPQERIETQPIIHRDREVREVRRIVQPMTQTEVRPAIIQTKGPSTNATEAETEDVEVETITKEPIIIETVKKRVIREVQPIIYREVEVVEEPSVPVQAARKPLAVVFGGTGLQGGSVAKALLKDGRWRVRTMTRNPKSPRAVRLASRGAEVVQGNQLVQEDLRRVLQGVDLVFAMTDAGDSESGKFEEEIGKQIALIASESGCKHFIWSTLPNATKHSGGKHHLPAFVRKASVNKLIKTLSFPYYTFVVPSFYYQNFDSIFAPRRENNVLVWTLPMSEKSYLTGMDVKDLGAAVLAIAKDPKQFNRRKITLAGNHLHPQDYIIKRALVTGVPSRVELVSPLDFPKFSSNPKAKEISEMMAYFDEFGLYGPKFSFTKNTQFPLKSYEEYLQSRRKLAQSQ